MKCFGFSYREGEEGELSVELCQEILKYHVNRNDGIPITGNIIIKSLTEGEKYLGIWHRTDVSPITIDETPNWAIPHDLFTHIFLNLKEGRGKINDNSTIEAKLFDETEPANPVLAGKKIENIMIPDLGEYLQVSHPIIGELENRGLEIPDSEYIPYTYAEIGPFTGENQYYAVRVKLTIDNRSFHRLVPENFQFGMRYYHVYGVEEIIKNILDVDLPHLERYVSGDVYEKYEDRFTKGLCEKKLIPKFYSIVAIDSPNSNNFKPHRMYSVELKEGLKDLTDEIWEGLYEHKELENLKGRVFWFVNQCQDQNFMLWFEGPMAEANIPAKK